MKLLFSIWWAMTGSNRRPSRCKREGIGCFPSILAHYRTIAHTNIQRLTHTTSGLRNYASLRLLILPLALLCAGYRDGGVMTRFEPGCLLLGAAVTASAFGVVVILKDMTKQKSWEERVAEARRNKQWHEERAIGME